MHRPPLGTPEGAGVDQFPAGSVICRHPCGGFAPQRGVHFRANVTAYLNGT